LAVPKPSKEEGGQTDVQVCLDACVLNNVIVNKPDSHMPTLREVIDNLGAFNYISIIDTANCYHQFPLKKEDREKTAFMWQGKQHMFNVVPFGLKTMTGHLQRIMEKTFKEDGL
jgi:hypothetical protein